MCGIGCEIILEVLNSEVLRKLRSTSEKEIIERLSSLIPQGWLLRIILFQQTPEKNLSILGQLETKSLLSSPTENQSPEPKYALKAVTTGQEAHL